MLFNSFDFVIFLPLVIVAYYLIPGRFRWMFLLAASYYFYMCWRVDYIVLIALSTMVDYWAGLRMSAQPDKKGRRKYLIASLVLNLGLLFFFKYFNFFSYNTEVLMSNFNVFYDSTVFDLLLPVGISFYTFQTLSYTIDIYRGKIKAEKHLGYFALYVSYFPQLVAGPIERSDRLIPQLRKEAKVSRDDIRYAINKILLGFFKKVVVADTVAIFCDQMFAGSINGTGLQYYFAAVLFAVQLFCDFSGYTDIAIGTARLMGVRLMENFNWPFWTSNMSDFWSRWHISLTSWIGDYIFKPMVMKYKRWGMLLSIGVMVLIGFWHGAQWSFIIFGLLHGVIIAVQKIWRKTKALKPFNKTKFAKYFFIVWNFHLLVLTGIFFRCKADTAWEVIKHMVTDFRIGFSELQSPFQTEFVVACFVSVLVLITAFFNRELRFRFNHVFIATIVFLIILFGQDLRNQFIYFQF